MEWTMQFLPSVAVSVAEQLNLNELLGYGPFFANIVGDL